MSDGKKVGLEIIGLSGVLQDLYNNRRTTILYAYSASKEKYIYFEQGYIKMVSSPNRPSVLAEGLQRAFGQIDDETLESVFQEQVSSGRNISSILVDVGANQDFIIEICSFQIQEEVYELFIWDDLQIELIEKTEKIKKKYFSEEMLSLPISIEVDFLLMEARRRIDEWTRITELLPSDKDVPYICEDIYDEDLTPETVHALSLFDSVKDFEEILKECRIPLFHGWEIFALLYEKKYIAIRTAEELKEISDLDEFQNEIFKRIKLYERAEELGDNSTETITWLAEAYEQAHLIRKASKKYKQLGEQCVELEQFDGAIEAYKRVIHFFHDDLDAHEKYIDSLFKKGNFQEGARASIVYANKLAVIDKRKAIYALENAYQHNPLSPEVLEKMAKFYCDLAENVDAMFTYTTLANLYKSRGLYEDTIQAYLKILDLDYTNIEARIKLADTYLVMGQHEKGVAEYKRLGDILTDTGLIDNPFGFTYLVNICEKIIEFEPTNLSAREWLADVYIFKKEFAKAKKVLFELLEFLENSNNPNELLSVLQKLVEIEPENRVYLKKLARIFKVLKMYDDATRDFVNLGEICLEEVSKLNQQGLADDARRIQEEGLEAFNEVLTINPFNLEIRQKRADLLHELNHTESAIEEYKLICHMTKAVNNYHDALTALFHIVELAPEHDPSAFLDMAKLCERQNKNDLAINFYKKYAIFNLEKGDLGEVLQSCRRLSILTPDDNEVKKWRDLVNEVMKG